LKKDLGAEAVTVNTGSLMNAGTFKAEIQANFRGVYWKYITVNLLIWNADPQMGSSIDATSNMHFYGRIDRQNHKSSAGSARSQE